MSHGLWHSKKRKWIIFRLFLLPPPSSSPPTSPLPAIRLISLSSLLNIMRNWLFLFTQFAYLGYGSIQLELRFDWNVNWVDHATSPTSLSLSLWTPTINYWTFQLHQTNLSNYEHQEKILAENEKSGEKLGMVAAIAVSGLLRITTHARHILTKHHLRHANHAHSKCVFSTSFLEKKNNKKTTYCSWCVSARVYINGIYNGICTFAILVHWDLCVIYWTFHVICICVCVCGLCVRLVNSMRMLV